LGSVVTAQSLDILDRPRRLAAGSWFGGTDGEGSVRFTGERFEMGRLVESTPKGWLVRLDDGAEVVVQVGPAEGLYRFSAGERVCVSFQPGQEPVLTGYLTER
jgi:hypothetical protein